MNYNNYNQQSSNMQQNPGQYQQSQQPQTFNQNPNMRNVMQQQSQQPQQQQQQGYHQQQQFQRQINPDQQQQSQQHRSVPFMHQPPNNPDMPVGTYLKTTYHSTSTNNMNPPSSGQLAPGSVGHSTSVGQVAPGSVGHPTSVGQLAPASVGTHGPTSVSQHGPTSISQVGPTSVVHPTSHGPTSVQGPTSVNAGPTSVGPGSTQQGGPGSVLQDKQSIASHVIDLSYPPKIIDPVAELKMLVLKDLRKATQALNEQVSEAIIYVQEQHQNPSIPENNPRSSINPQSTAQNPLSANPQSIQNPQSISNPKSEDGLHRRIQRNFSKEKYENAWLTFFAICDKIEAKASLILESYELQKRFDKMCEMKVPADIINQGYVSLIQPFLESMNSTRNKMLETVTLLNDSMQEFRKITDEGEFIAIANSNNHSQRFYDRIESETKKKLKQNHVKEDIPDTISRKSPPLNLNRSFTKKEKKSKTKKLLTEEEKQIKKMQASNWRFLEDTAESASSDEENVATIIEDYEPEIYFLNQQSNSNVEMSEREAKRRRTDQAIPQTSYPSTSSMFFQDASSMNIMNDPRSQYFKNKNIQQMEQSRAELLGYEDDESMDECDPPPPPKTNQ